MVPISVLAEKLSHNLLRKIETSYPIRGKIKDLDGAVVVLNIGSNAGVVPGQTFKVLQEGTLLQVSSVTSDQSFTKILSDNKAVMAGQRVEILKAQ